MNSDKIKNLVDDAVIEEAIVLHPVDLASFLAMELPPREFILEPWLPTAGICMIHAYRGIGKTHVALGIAYAVVTGGEFLNWKALKARNVVYVDGEMPANTLQMRLADIVVMMGAENVDGKLTIFTPDFHKFGMPDLATLEGQTLLNNYIPEDTDLIIIDNLSCLARSGKENEASDWVILQTWVLSQRARGRSVT